MSSEGNQAPTDLEQMSSDDEKGDRVLLTYREKATYNLIREGLTELLDKHTDSFDATRTNSLNPEKYKLRYKNMLVELGNKALCEYKESVRYVHDHELKNQKYDHCQPNNPNLLTRNQFLREQLERHFNENQKTVPESVKIHLEKREDSNLYVEAGDRTVPVTEMINNSVRLSEETPLLQGLEKEKKRIKQISNGLVDALEEKKRKMRAIRERLQGGSEKVIREEPRSPHFGKALEGDHSFSYFK